MVRTIKQLEKEIAEQRRKISKEQSIIKKTSKRRELEKQLFKLKQRKLIGAGVKAKKLSKKFGRGILKVGKKVAPVIKKQARLIREQQLRDEAIEKARRKRKKISKKSPKKRRKKLDIFSPIDF